MIQILLKNDTNLTQILLQFYFIFLYLFIIIIINITCILHIKMFNPITFNNSKISTSIILKNVFHFIQNYPIYIFLVIRNKILFTSKSSYFQLYKIHFYSTRLTLTRYQYNPFGTIANKCVTIRKSIFDLEKKKRDFRREMPLLWIRFTLAGRTIEYFSR